MIKIFHENGRSYPKIYCDECNEIIEDAQKANAIWVVEDNGPSIVFYVHKGKCDKNLDRQFQKATASDELDLHLAKILANTCLVNIDEAGEEWSYNFDKLIQAFDHIRKLNDAFG